MTGLQPVFVAAAFALGAAITPIFPGCTTAPHAATAPTAPTAPTRGAEASTHADPGAIVELAAAPVVDGRLDEWPAGGAVVLSHRNGAETGPPPRAWLGYDHAHLYLALDVPDDTLAFPERSWRFGDGFYLTVLMPGGGTASASHVSFGFSRVGDRLEKVVVNRSGQYFPPISTGAVAFAMEPGPGSARVPDGGALPWEGSATYEVAVPWSILAPAHPLAADSLAVNIVVSDRDDGSARTFHMLAPDPGFDTERTPVRHGAMLPLARAPRASPAAASRAADAPFTAWLPSPVVRAGEDATVHVAASADIPGAVRLSIQREGQPIAEAAVERLDGGDVRRASVAVPVPARTGTGPATLIATFTSSPVGTPAAPDAPRIAREVFVVDSAHLAATRARLERLADATARPARPDDADRYARQDGAADPVALATASALIRLAWIEAFAASAPSNVPVDPAASWWAEARAMEDHLAAGVTDFLYRPGPLRLAHRSAIDGSLQPYSVQLPPDFDPRQTGGYPLLVALHGSGVDERGTLRAAGTRAAPRGWIVVAPGGRGLSDWYTGDAETDVLEALDHAAALFPVDTSRVALAGFSMGGYGAWRLALRHPHRFRAVAIMAGADCPPAFVTAECATELLARPRDDDGPDRPLPPLLVLHGARDRAVPVEQARALVDALRAARWPHRYTEFADAGHGRADWWDRVVDWLADPTGE